MVDLRDKLPALAPWQEVVSTAEQSPSEAVVEDALSALLNLGYKKAMAQRAIEKAKKGLQGEATLEVLLKESLRSIA
jgi:Holliday junction DNA helicase RuvA